MANLLPHLARDRKKSGNNNLLEGANLDPREIASERISKKYPDMPEWLKKAILSASSDKKHPFIENAADFLEEGSKVVPAIAGGALEGAAMPIRGIASLFGDNAISNATPFTEILPRPNNILGEAAQAGGEFAGSLGTFGPLFKGINAYNKAVAPGVKGLEWISAAETGALGASGDPTTEEGLMDRLIGGGIGLGIPAAIKSAEYLGPEIGHIFSNLGRKLKDIGGINKLKSEIGVAGQEHLASELEAAANEAVAGERHGSSSPEKIAEQKANYERKVEDYDRRIGQEQRKLDKHEREIVKFTKQLHGLDEPIAPFVEEPLSDFAEAPPRPLELIYEEHAPTAEHQAYTAKQNLENIENEIGQHLNRGAMHDVHLLSNTEGAFKANKSEINHGYNELESSLQETPMTLEKGDNTKIIEDLKKVWPEHDHDSPGFKRAVDALTEKYGKKEGTASDYLRAYRETKNLLNKANKRGYDPNTPPEEKYKWQERGRELEEISTRMKSKLDSAIGPENTDVLNNLTNRWREEVAVLYRNPLFNKLRSTRQWPENMMKALRGDEPGNVFLKELIKKNPESLKHIVGQKYAKAPAKLQEWDELSQEYLAEMPELHELRGRHSQAKGHHDISQENIIKAKELDAKSRAATKAREAEIKLAEKEEAAINKAKSKDEAMRAKKAQAYEAQKEQTLTKRERGRETLKERIETTKENKKTINENKGAMERDRKIAEQKLRALDNDIVQLEKSVKSKNLSLQRKVELEKRLEEARRLRNRILYGLGAVAVSKVLSK